LPRFLSGFLVVELMNMWDGARLELLNFVSIDSLIVNKRLLFEIS
jgi:hypothetical protein